MKKQAFILGLVALLSMPAATSADIYRWKDANGVMHFSNQPPPEGVTLIEKIEETPYDAEADRRRIEEERRLRLERQKLEIEERKAETALREREAQLKLEDANRRLEEARRLEQEARERTKARIATTIITCATASAWDTRPTASAAITTGRPAAPTSIASTTARTTTFTTKILHSRASRRGASAWETAGEARAPAGSPEKPRQAGQGAASRGGASSQGIRPGAGQAGCPEVT